METKFYIQLSGTQQRRALRRGIATQKFEPYKYPRAVHFSLHLALVVPSSPAFVCVMGFAYLQSKLTVMAPRKSIPAKRQRFGSISRAAPPPLEDPHRFVSWEAKRIYHESLFNCSFVVKCDFLTSNAFFNFTIQNRGWQMLCATPALEWPWSCKSSTPTCPSRLAPPSSSEVGGSSLVPRPSTGFTTYGMTTMRSIECYLLMWIMSA